MKPLASPSNNYYYNKRLLAFSRQNKKTMTKSAAATWKYILRGKMMMGYSFRRERPILNYIADFACLELLLTIEIDGITHNNPVQAKKDKKRDQDLAEIGFTVLRFSSWEVLNQIEDVSICIAQWIKQKEKANGIVRVEE